MSKRIVVAFAGALCMVSWLAGVGHAQVPADKEKEAKDHYEQGIVQYNLTNYQEAIDHFKRAYELTKAPALLFNIAQAYRLKKDYAVARTFYQNYVREQSAVNAADPNIKEAESFIAEMERLMKEAGGTGATAATPTNGTGTTTATNPTTTEPPTPAGGTGGSTTTPSAPPVPSPVVPEGPDEPERPGSGMKLAGMAVGAAGVVMLGVGSYFWWKTEKYERETEENCSDQSCLDMRESQGKRYQALGWTLGSAGVAAIGTGVALYLVGSSKEGSSTEVTFAPGPDGAAVIFSGRF